MISPYLYDHIPILILFWFRRLACATCSLLFTNFGWSQEAYFWYATLFLTHLEGICKKRASPSRPPGPTLVTGVFTNLFLPTIKKTSISKDAPIQLRKCQNYVTKISRHSFCLCQIKYLLFQLNMHSFATFYLSNPSMTFYSQIEIL